MVLALDLRELAISLCESKISDLRIGFQAHMQFSQFLQSDLSFGLFNATCSAVMHELVGHVYL